MTDLSAEATSQDVFLVLRRSYAILPSQARLALELASEFSHGIVQGAGTKDLALTAFVNAAPPRPGLTMIVGSH